MNLTSKKRKTMPQSDFLGPGRSFPANDANHARLAISGATRSEHAGNISAGQAAHIKAGARARLKSFDHADAGSLPADAKHPKGSRGSM